MLVPSKVIKINSKIALKDKMVSCMAASVGFLCCLFAGLFVCDVLSFITQSITVSLALSLLFVIFAVFPAFLGLLRYMWLILSNITQNPIQIFYYFSSLKLYRRSVNISTRITVRSVAWGFICFFPSIVVGVLTNTAFYEAMGYSIPEFIGNLWVLEVFLALGGLIGWFFIIIRPYLAPFLFVTDENMPPYEVMSTAYRLSKRTRFDFIGLIFSMSVWILISLAGIPIIFTIPYFLMTYTVHCCYAVAQYNSMVKEMNSHNYTVGI